jgi:hypothetical protein
VKQNSLPSPKIILLSVVLTLSWIVGAGMLIYPGTSYAAESVSQKALTAKQLEKIAQPIALYPDLLLQQTLAASTFPEQVLDAALYNEQGKAPASIKNQPWDDSVKAIANYPSILTMLAGDLDWTISLGGAFINQSQDLIKAIQSLRARAKAVGNLKASEQQHVIEEQGSSGNTIIIIEPAQPQVVYVPTTTTVVYEKPVPATSLWTPLATFGLGMAVGYAMGNDNDNYYYGGGFYGPGFWRGGSAVNSWVDYRHDRWDDAYDFARDRQDWRQDYADDQREHRQDLARKQQDWRNEQKNRPANMSPEQRAKATTRANEARARSVANGSARVPTGSIDRNQANERLNAARSNPQIQQRAESMRNNPATQQRLEQARSNQRSAERMQAARANVQRGSGLSGMGSSGRSVNREQARGSASLSRSGGGIRGGGSGGGGRRR